VINVFLIHSVIFYYIFQFPKRCFFEWNFLFTKILGEKCVELIKKSGDNLEINNFLEAIEIGVVSSGFRGIVLKLCDAFMELSGSSGY
jgi:hypothetical protein